MHDALRGCALGTACATRTVSTASHYRGSLPVDDRWMTTPFCMWGISSRTCARYTACRTFTMVTWPTQGMTRRFGKSVASRGKSTPATTAATGASSAARAIHPLSTLSPFLFGPERVPPLVGSWPTLLRAHATSVSFQVRRVWRVPALPLYERLARAAVRAARPLRRHLARGMTVNASSTFKPLPNPHTQPANAYQSFGWRACAGAQVRRACGARRGGTTRRWV